METIKMVILGSNELELNYTYNYDEECNEYEVLFNGKSLGNTNNYQYAKKIFNHQKEKLLENVDYV